MLRADCIRVVKPDHALSQKDRGGPILTHIPIKRVLWYELTVLKVAAKNFAFNKGKPLDILFC